MASSQTVSFLHITDPAVSGGGADVRYDNLVRRLAPLNVRRVEATEVSKGTLRAWSARFLYALRGVPPRLFHPTDNTDSVKRLRHDNSTVIASTIWSASLLPRSRRSRMIYDAHNVEWLVQRQLAAQSKSPVRKLAYTVTLPWTRRWETSLVRSVSDVWAVTEADAATFRAMGARRVAVVRNGCEVHTAVDLRKTGATLLFVGSLRARFNREGVEWFLNDCLPLIRASEPDVEVVLVGAGGEDLGGARVRSLGFVDDLSSIYQAARAVIVPLLAGGGSRLKIAEAAGWGVPVISTSVGAEGYETGDSVGIRIADTAEGFAGECAHLLASASEASALGAAAHRIAATIYSWDYAAAIAAGRVRETTAID